MPGNALLIALGYYPSNAPGAHRPVKMAKYLPEFGWHPVVLCADWTRTNRPERFDPGLALEEDVCHTIRVPHPARRAGRLGGVARRAVKALFPYSTPRVMVRSFLERASSFADSEKVDVIWSTYSPGLTHLVAARISRQYGIPWVADFRDLPDQVYDSWRVRRNVRYEVAVCASASALVTTNRALAARLRARHGAPVHVVLNGFDPDDYDPAARPSTEKFVIRYCGTLYEYFDPRPLFRALDLLYERGEADLGRIAVEFYGPPTGQIRRLTAGFECARVVRACPRVPYKEMLRLQQESAALLLLKSETSGDAIPCKLFEYLGARRPILTVPGDRDIVDEILVDTGSGVSAGGAEEIARILLTWYEAWSSTGELKSLSIPERVERYCRREQTRRLAGVFESVLGRENGTGATEPASEELQTR